MKRSMFFLSVFLSSISFCLIVPFAHAQYRASIQGVVTDSQGAVISGALDILVAQNDGPPILLKNNSARGNHWLGVKLVGKKSNPDAIGAHITWQAGDLKRSRLKIGGGSYLSSHDSREVLGN